MPAELKQYCSYCNGKIAYPVNMAGTATNCPHCRREVELAKDVRQECRACGEKVVFSESMVGEQTRCPGCGKIMKLHRSGSEALLRPGNTQETGVAQSQYYLAMRGKTEGPFTEADVCDLVEKGHVRADTRIQMGKGGAWYVLGQLHQFTTSLHKQNMPDAPVEETFTDEGPPEITLLMNGQQYGPYTIGHIRHALKTGGMDGFAEAHRPGMTGWLQLKRWDEFKNIDIVKNLGAGSIRPDDTALPYAIECLSVGIIFIVLQLLFWIDPMTGMIYLWVAALAWVLCRGFCYPDFGADDQDSVSAQSTRDFKTMAGMLAWMVLMFIRACAGSSISSAGVMFVLVPFVYLIFRGTNAGIRYFFRPIKNVAGMVINIIGLILIALQILLFFIGMLGAVV
jgi:hypothetical protein